MKRFTLTDLTDKKNLIEWLNYDGNPPMVDMPTGNSPWRNSRFIGYGTERKPVADEETLDRWWSNHRQWLALEWSKSPHNAHKPQTCTQFLQYA